MGRVIIHNLLRFLAFIVLQIVLFKNIGYYNLAIPFPYVLIIFLLPLGISNFTLYLCAFITGITVDAFYDSLGIHAAACVALAWFRILFTQVTLEVEVRQSFRAPTWGDLGAKWYLSYISLGVLFHHITLFIIEVFSFQNILYTLISILFSTIFTISLVLLASLLIYRRKSRLSA